jgi:hypothetical protein
VFARVLRVLLIVLLIFLAITSVAGGVALITGAIAPGVEMLEGSPFKDYTVPGLSLAILVGGPAIAAVILLLRRHPWGVLVGGVAAMGIIIFESVEVLVIGSEPGVARTLQSLYFAMGGGILIVAAALWLSRPGQTA